MLGRNGRLVAACTFEVRPDHLRRLCHVPFRDSLVFLSLRHWFSPFCGFNRPSPAPSFVTYHSRDTGNTLEPKGLWIVWRVRRWSRRTRPTNTSSRPAEARGFGTSVTTTPGASCNNATAAATGMCRPRRVLNSRRSPRSRRQPTRPSTAAPCRPTAPRRIAANRGQGSGARRAPSA